MPAQPPPSPPFFVGAGPAGAAYPEIRRQANLPAWPYPFRLPPSLPHSRHPFPIPAIPPAPRHFSLATALPAPRIQRFAVRRISPLRRTRSAFRHPSPYARPAFRSPPLSLAARSVAAYPKDSPSGESPRFGWGGLSRRGPAPSLTPRLPSHAPPFPQPSFTLGGGCREGGSPPDFPSCPAALPAGAGRFPLSTGTPSPALFAPHAPAVPPTSARRKSLPLRPRTCARRSRVRARGPWGPALPRADGASRLHAEGKRPPRKRTASVSGTAQRAYSVSSSSPPVKQNRVPDTAEMSTRNLRPPNRKRRL